MQQIKLFLLFALIFGLCGCSPKIASVVTTTSEKTVITTTYRDSNIVVKADSAIFGQDLSKGLTQPQKEVIDAIDMPSDTTKEGNIEIIKSIHKGKLTAKVIDLQHKQLVQGLNKDTKETKDSTTTIVKTPAPAKIGFWESLKNNTFYMVIGGIIIILLGIIIRFKTSIIKMASKPFI